MTIIEEGRALRADVAKLRPDKRRRYGDGLIARILAWVARATTSGMTEAACGHALGIKTWRLQTWRARSMAPASSPPGTPTSLALVPIELGHVAARGGCALVAPSGYRVEGLTLAEAATLLRELA